MPPKTLLPQTLTWGEVDPTLHSFDSSAAYEIAKALIPSKGDKNEKIRFSVAEGNAWEESVTDALVEHYGRWACGWRWARDEGSIGGGPISIWCCPKHSCTTRDETAKRVHEALLQWRKWIEELARRFAALGPGESETLVAAFEKAVVSLVTDVVERTAAGDAWYAHCEQVLGWYLEMYNIPSASATALIRRAIGGRFESWVAPDDEVVSDVARKVASDATQRLPRNYH
jgi:hypothetical protein